jgi:splicing factor 1
MFAINPEYKPPPDYKPPMIKVNDKVMIPQEEHPEINFVGLLIGPRGNTLKSMESETGGKIIIRGKGSVKEGKVGRKDGQPLPGEDEPLHAYVTSTNPESVKKAVEKIKQIIREAVDVPEGQNDLRRHQLRELALLNGTLREGDGPRCSNCGAGDHKTWQCQDKPNVTNNVVCTTCGGVGHISKDCMGKKRGPGMKVQKLPWTKNTCLSWLNWVRVQPPHPHLPPTILGVVLITAKKTNRIGVIILGVLEECLEPHQEPLDP